MAVTSVSAVDRANQRNAVLAGFLGWTLDAFDFFILTLVIEDLAHAFFPGSPLEDSRPRIALAITLTLAMRPIGAVVFGLMADRYGRRLPLMLNVIFYALISVLCGLSQTYWQFIGLRMLFGIGMGASGAWARRWRSSPRRRASADCCQDCCRRATPSAICWRRSPSAPCTRGRASSSPAT